MSSYKNEQKKITTIAMLDKIKQLHEENVSLKLELSKLREEYKHLLSSIDKEKMKLMDEFSDMVQHHRKRKKTIHLCEN